MTKAVTLLREGKPARAAALTPEEVEPFRQLGLLTAEARSSTSCNVEEGAAATGNDDFGAVAEKAKREGAGCVVISARIEEEVAQLPPANAKNS